MVLDLLLRLQWHRHSSTLSLSLSLKTEVLNIIYLLPAACWERFLISGLAGSAGCGCFKLMGFCEVVGGGVSGRT